MAKVKGQIATKQELADIFGVSLPTIEAWVRGGCPFVEKGGMGKSWKFDTAAVATWQKDKATEDAKGTANVTAEELARRKNEASTQLVELELAKAKGEVAPVEEFERATAMLMGEIRQNIMNVPQRVVLTLLGETDEAVFKSKLRTELVLALETAANADLDPADDTDNDD